MKGINMIFLIGWFRSGTSMSWNIMRRTGQYYCYYEPFHEQLPYLSHSPCPGETDPSHRSITDYWAEYRAIPREQLAHLWKQWFALERWHLTEDDPASEMKAYIDFLASQAPKPTVFKFVRACFRVRWLRHNFPDARIIWINRDPRKTWESMQRRDAATANLVDGQQITQQGFTNYILQIAIDLGFDIKNDLYGTFYDMWSSSYSQATPYVDDVWWYEDIVSNYHQWAQQKLVDTKIVTHIPAYEVTSASDTPYRQPVPHYLDLEIDTINPTINQAHEPILAEVSSRHKEIVRLQSRILELEADICRIREKQNLYSGNLAGFLKEKAMKNILRLRSRYKKP